MTNGEKFKTVEERVIHFSAFCGAHRRDICKCTGKCVRDVKCALEWLDLEYKEAVPKPCPFCGSKAKIVDYRPSSRPSGVTYYFVQCEECFGKSVSKTTRDEAITAWNRRVNGQRRETK